MNQREEYEKNRIIIPENGTDNRIRGKIMIHDYKPPTINDVLTDPASSFWLRDALRSIEKRDPVDAFNDAALLMRVVSARLTALQDQQQNQQRACMHGRFDNQCLGCADLKQNGRAA